MLEFEEMTKLAHPPQADVRKLAESLIGSCHISDPPELHEWSIEKLKEFDALCFSCEACGWWCDAEECNEDDGWYCNDCFKERFSA
jgi:hypothetical protein